MKHGRPYIPLYFRSCYSLQKGMYTPAEICGWAFRNNFPAIAMIDINNLYGVVQFILAARERGIKPIVGVSLQDQGRELGIAYVLNPPGFARLAGILTSWHFDNCPYFTPPFYNHRYSLLRDLVAGGWEGLAIVSRDPEVLDKLRRVSCRDLYVRLTYGRKFDHLVRMARELELPLLALNEGVFLEEEDREIYRTLRAIDLNRVVDELPRGEGVFSDNRLVLGEDMERYFSAVPEALGHAWDLAQRAGSEGILREQFIFPAYEDLTEEESFGHLRNLCLQGIESRYGVSSPALEERLDYELEIIREKRFSSYFLVVRDIVLQCPRTCGRGSSAASLVAYLLGITHVDPLAYNFYFERFLNKGRKDPPDMDIDFPWDERDSVLRYVFKKYRGRAGMVANHVTFGGRSALREVARATGLKDRDLDEVMRYYHLKQRDKIPGYIRSLAGRIRGLPHYISLHCGGVVITPGPITDYTHLQLSVARYPLIAWEKESAEEAGLVKIDLLGNRSLAVLRDTLNMVNKRYGREINWKAFNPLNNPRARGLIEQGDTLGLFYIESPATRQLLKRMRRGDYESVIIASSIIRPAANSYIRLFVERLHGKSYEPLHASLSRTLEETFGIMVYQEDVSRVAMDLAGFSPEEADALRKAITRRDSLGEMEKYKDRFFSRGESRGVEKEDLQKIWEIIRSFSEGYSFCKAHSASYALVSYKLAYCKAYYPMEFMTAVINNGGGYYSRQTYLNELQRMGIRVLGPDINKSEKEYIIEGFSIRVGFRQLSEISSTFTSKILEERKKAPFKDLQDFLRRLNPGLPDMRLLVRSGVLDSIAEGLTRPQIFWFYFNYKQGDSLFIMPPVPDFIGDYSEYVKLMDEIKTMGIIISRHPLTIFRRRLAAMKKEAGIGPLISSRELDSNRNRLVYIAGTIVTGKKVRTRQEEDMIFVSFEDPYAVYETVFFPKAFERYFPLLDRSGAYLIYGRVEEEQGALNINVESLRRLSRAARWN